MSFATSDGDSLSTIEIFIVSELLRLLEDPNSMVKFNAETSLCRLFGLQTDSPTLPLGDQFGKVKQQLSPLCSKMKQKFKTRSLDNPQDVDVSVLNL